MFAPPPLPRTLDAALRDISSAKEAVRASAIADLVRHGQASSETRARVIGPIEKALADRVAGVRAAAAVALADLRADDALPSLLLAVEDDDAHVRQMALNALGEIGDPRAAPRLRRAVTDGRAEVRYQAVIALTRVAQDDGDEVTQTLLTAMGDDDDDVRYIALRLAEEALDEHRPLDVASLVTRAEALVLDRALKVRIAASIFAGKAGSKAGRAVLLDVVAGRLRPDEREDEAEAVELVGALGIDEAVPDLERRAYGAMRLVRDTSAWHAKIALARLGHARARAEIEKDLGAAKRTVLEAAVVASGRARLVHLAPKIASLPPLAADPALVREALERLRGP
jgi:HEAT repeat protein